MLRSNQQKKLLLDVSIIRPILIILLVFYHAFAIYSGAWAPIDYFPEVPVYWWLDKLSYACMLESFVFVSGYVFGYQVRTKGEEKLNAKKLFLAKFKRLIIPCALFSLLYILLFGDISQPLGQTLYGLINGVGHMWFLPMLFWCFVGVWVFEKLRLNTIFVFILLILSSIFWVFSLPLQIGKTIYYMLFFYTGYWIQRSSFNMKSLYKLHSVLLLSLLFVVLFPILTLFKEIVAGGGNI